MSDSIADNSTLPLKINYIPDFIYEKYKEDLSYFQENKEKYMEELKKLLIGDKSSESVDFEEDFLQQYLIQCKYDATKAFSKLQNYLKLRRDYSFFYQSVKFDFTSNPSCHFLTPLPHRLSDGSVILLFEMGKWDPEEISLESIEQITYMVFQQQLRHPLTQMGRIHILHDFTGSSFQHLKYCTLKNMFLLNHVSFEVLPLKFAGFHVVNGSYLFNLLLRLSKPFLPEYFRKIICIHSSVEEIFEHFPKSAIPEKYGGTLTDYYMADWLKKANEEHDNFPIGGQKNFF